MASLYTFKDSNIRKTWLLFTLFFIIVIGIGYVIARAYGNPSILYAAVMFSVFMSVLSYWYSDKIVLAMSRAKQIDPKAMPELYRVVENLAITAGLPVPKVYLINEMAPNAFATGRDPKHAVLAVTEGLLKRLDRSELEGVIAHELSHIGNRDMLLGTVAAVLVGFIAILADFFMRSMFWGGGRRRDNDRGNAAGIFMLVGIALSILAPIAAQLIQLAISRRREFLADTSGALLTRYPEGLARALEKISKDPTPMTAPSAATAHLWLADPFSAKGGSAFGGKGKQKLSWFTRLFMTHPPIKERIAALRGMK